MTTPEPIDAMKLKALLTPPFRREAWEEFSATNLHLRIGNDPPALSRDEALDRLNAFLARLIGFGCDFCDVWQRREAIYVETTVAYHDADGTCRTIPCVLVARATKGILRDLRFHLDPSPLPPAPRRAPHR